jgi:outer membrane protein assembly factor BamB
VALVPTVHDALGASRDDGRAGAPPIGDPPASGPGASLLALDLDTGAERWRAPDAVEGCAVDATTAVLWVAPEASDVAALAARDLRDGQERWRMEVGRTAQLLAVTDRAIHLAHAANVSEVDPRDGRVRRFALDRVITPAFGARRVGDVLVATISRRTSLATAAPDSLVAIDLRRETVAWSRDAASSIPVVTGGVAVVAAVEELEAVDVDDGERRWTVRVERPGSCSLARAGGVLTVATAGRLLALERAGRRRGAPPAPHAAPGARGRGGGSGWRSCSGSARATSCSPRAGPRPTTSR